MIGRIRSEFASPELSPTELADSVGLSRYYFARSFREQRGCTPSQYRQQVREGWQEKGEQNAV